MNHERQLEHIAANLDDLSVQVEEVKVEVAEKGAEAPMETIKNVEKEIARAADAIENAVDRD
jgi:hypothetical protein